MLCSFSLSFFFSRKKSETLYVFVTCRFYVSFVYKYMEDFLVAIVKLWNVNKRVQYDYICPNGRAGPARHGHGWTRHDFGVLRHGTPVSRAGPGWHVGPNPCPGTARQLLIGPGRGHGQPVGAVPGSGLVT